MRKHARKALSSSIHAGSARPNDMPWYPSGLPYLA